MAWQKVSKEEYEKWAKANPGQVGRVGGQEVKSPYPEAQNLGVIGNFLRTLSTPFRKAAAMPESIISDLRGGGKFNSVFLTPEEEMRWEEDPLKSGAKGIAGLASFGIPGGSSAGTVGRRIASAAGKGALSGGLGGLGYSDEGDELQSILRGGLTGGVVGGALQGIGEGAQALANRQPKDNIISKFGEDLERNAVGIKTPKSPQGAQQADTLFDDVYSITNGDVTPKGLNSAYNRESSIIGKSIKASSASASLEDIAQQASQKLADEMGMTLDRARRLIDASAKRASVSGKLNAQSLASLKKITQPNALKVAKAFEIGGSPSAKIYSDYVLNEIADGILKSGLDDVGISAYTNLAKLYQAAPDVISKADKAGHITFANLKIPTGNIPQKAQIAVGKGLQKIGGGLNIGQGGADLISNLASAGQKGIPAISAIGGIEGQQTQDQFIDQGMYQQPQGPQINKLALAQAVLSGQISSTEANFLMDLLGSGAGEQKALTGNQSKATALQGSLDTLRNVWGTSGTGAKVGEMFGQGIGSNARILNNAKDSVKEDLGRLQSQGAINAQEREEFEKRLPNVWDSPQVVEQKFQSIQNVIDAYMLNSGVENNEGSALFNMLGLQ